MIRVLFLLALFQSVAVFGCIRWLRDLYNELTAPTPPFAENPYAAPREITGNSPVDLNYLRQQIQALRHFRHDDIATVSAGQARGNSRFGYTTIESFTDSVVIHANPAGGTVSLRVLTKRMTLPEGVQYREEGKSGLEDGEGLSPQHEILTIYRVDSDTQASYEDRVRAVLNLLTKNL